MYTLLGAAYSYILNYVMLLDKLVHYWLVWERIVYRV